MSARVLLTAMLALAVPAATPATAQIADKQVDELEGVEIVEHPGAEVPLDLSFVDEDGKTVQLQDYFDGERPVILTLNYYSCPMLCTLMLNGLVDGLKQMEWTPGQEFEMVTVSINPTETPRLATLKKQTYLEHYARPSAASGWHFLTGEKANIDALAEPLGYGYKYDPETGQYAHAAVVYVVTPDGRISRYLYGVLYDPQTLRLSLVEAADGEIGTSMDQFLLTCFHYSPDDGRYTLQAMNVARIGSVAVMLLLGITIGGYFVREKRRSPKGTSKGNAKEAPKGGSA